MSRVITIEERMKLFERNKDKIAHMHSFYDRGADLNMRVIVFWSQELHNWLWVEIPEPYCDDYQINEEYAKKYEKLVEKVKNASIKFERMIDELKYTCPICKKELIYPKNNKWIKSTLHVWSADIIAWCPRCNITLIVETQYYTTEFCYYTYEKGEKRRWKLHIIIRRYWRTWQMPPHLDAEQCSITICNSSEISKKIVSFVKEELGDEFKYISVRQ